MWDEIYYGQLSRQYIRKVLQIQCTAVGARYLSTKVERVIRTLAPPLRVRVHPLRRFGNDSHGQNPTKAAGTY